MDRANSHTKSYNIPRSFEAMYIYIKYELRAWVTCGLQDRQEKFCRRAIYGMIDGSRNTIFS